MARGLLGVLALSLWLVGSVQGDTKACMDKMMNDCQVQVMMMVSAEDKQAAGEALKQCALGAGGSSLCDGVLDDDGKPTDAFKAEMKQCGMKAMMLCPLQAMTLSSSLMSIQDDLKNGGKLDSSTMTTIWNQVKSAFACLKTKKDRLPENCQFLSDEHLADADGLFNGDDDSDTKKSGGGGGGGGGSHGSGDKNSKEGKKGGDDPDGGGNFMVLVVMALVVAGAAAGFTYFMMRRRRQAEILHAELDMEAQNRPHTHAQPAAVVVQAQVVAPGSGEQSYSGVPTNNNLKDDLEPHGHMA